ncbi:hypothetical protein [Streptomonospora salina]|uniref:Uncharacterized protein n=1 Tax=Streptomonospora salina TaxID=104205 RepID=A0A841E3S3_9ACTN|nr:hypothetical protein [Streptomonospora salina]MBB5997805.1 hypothetical protein [Streptomonospora salina]
MTYRRRAAGASDEFRADPRSTPRDDPDFHQRFRADVQRDAIEGRWEASDDEGRTWRKDVDLTLLRSPERP